MNMKRTFLIIVCSLLCVVCHAQKKLFDLAFAAGRNPTSFYVIQNTKNKKLKLEKLVEYAQKNGYIVGNYTEKETGRSGNSKKTISTFEFLPLSEFESYIFSNIFSNSALDLSMCQNQGTAYYFTGWDNNSPFGLLQDIKWSGKVDNGKIEGNGVGYFNEGNGKMFFIEGSFEHGFPTGETKTTTYEVGEKCSLFKKENVSTKSISIGKMYDGMAMIQRNGLYGFVDKEGKLAIAPKYPKVIQQFKNGQAIVVINDKESIINKGGAFVDFTDRQKQIDAQLAKEEFERWRKQATKRVGDMTAYYATESIFSKVFDYSEGQLICDSNDPMNRIVDLNATYFKYEGDDTGEYYSSNIPKSKVRKEIYEMNLFPVKLVGDRCTFKSAEGDIITIFKSDINGHKYYNWNYDDGYTAYYNAEQTKKNRECYVLLMDDNYSVQLEIKDGNFDLYHENPYYDNNRKGCRYREGLIGILEEKWWNKEGWEGPSYSKDGKLLVDQYEVDGIASYWSIAYVADKDALYLNGKLYYRQTPEESSIKNDSKFGLKVDNKIYTMAEVDTPPSFSGGDAAMYAWLSRNLQYPPIAQENGIQGTVVVSFTVGADGSINNIKVVHGKDPSLDKEAVRVVGTMPRWNPGQINGQNVPVSFTLPIKFQLQ